MVTGLQYSEEFMLYMSTVDFVVKTTRIMSFGSKGRIRLDIGGNIFTTSRLTLTQDPESMLAAMFSGRHNICLETDGTVFIDRDGTHFRYILNYLRDGRLNTDGLPRNRQVLRELRNEATYYQLHSLLQEIEKLFWENMRRADVMN